MSKQSKFATANQLHDFAAGNKPLHISVYSNREFVGISVAARRDEYNNGTWTADQAELVAAVSRDVLARLQPAFQAMFQKLLQERREQLHAEAIEELKKSHEVDEARRAKELADLETAMALPNG